MKTKFTFPTMLFLIFCLCTNIKISAQWSYSNKPTGNTLYSVSYLNDSSVWAIGSGSTILHYDGTQWKKQEIGVMSSSNLNAVFFVNDSLAWAAGDEGFSLKYDGKNWGYSQIASGANIKSLFFLNDHQGWAGGNGSNIYYYNGTNWVAQSLPYYSYINSIHFTDDQHGWAVGMYENSGWKQAIYKFDGTNWTVEKTIDGYGYFNDVTMLDATTGWAVGDKTTIYKYNGIDWTQEVSGDPNVNNSFRSVKFKDANNGWAMNQYGGIYKYNGTSWALDTALNTYLYDLALTNSDICWAVGESGNIAKKENGVWNSIFKTTYDLRKIRVVDENNQWLVQGSKMLKYNNGEWEEKFNTNMNSITDAYFFDSANGWALSSWAYYKYDGNSWQMNNWNIGGNWFYMNSIYFTDTSTGWSVGDYGKILKYGNGKWQEQKSNTLANLYSVYFINNNKGWAVGDSGVVLSYNNGVWTKMNSNFTKTLKSVFFTDADHGWAVGARQSILKYQDGKWVTYSSGTYDYYYNQEIYFKDGAGWIVGDQNSFFKFDGADWIKQNTIAEYSNFYSIAFVDSVNGWLLSNSNLYETHNGGVPSNAHSSSISVIGTQTASIWNADTIKILGNVTVNGNLTIRPGVFVEYEGNYSISINSGVLSAVGTSAKRIKFDVNDTIISGTNCGWSSVGVNSYTSDTSKIKYCDFYNSNNVPLGFSNGYIDVSNNNINEAYGGISLNSVKGGKIVSNKIENTTYYGISSYNSKNIAFGGNQILNGYNGIMFNNSSGITLDSNVVAYNSYLGIDFQKTDFTLRNTKVCNNQGGAMYMIDSKGNIVNSLIANNDLFSAWESGTYYSGALYMINSQINILNSVIANNAELNNYGHKGGGLFFKFTNGNIYNSIIWGNKEFDIDSVSLQPSQVFIYNNGSKPNFYNCAIYGGVAGFKKNTSVSYTGISQKIIDYPPSFVEPTTGIGYGLAPEYDALAANWEVDSSSVCINGGTNSIGNMKFPDIDLGNNKRILNGVVDIGAYENRIPPIDVNCGVITDSTEWAADTVRIKGCNLVIESEKLLQIRAGTLVEFWGPYKIIVKGAIKAIGTKSEPIRFTLHDTTGFATDNTVGWQGFEFDNSNGDMDNSDSSVFKQCIFEYAKDTSSYYYSGIGMFGLIKAKFFSKLAIQNSLFRNNFVNLTEYWYNSGLINLQYSNNVKISNNRFSNNKAAVFSFESSNTSIYNNTIVFNNPQGQYKNVISINNSDCMFVNNFVANNLPGNYAAVINANSSNVKFVNNVIANNLDTSAASYQYAIMGYGGTFLLSNNTIVNNFGNSVYFYNGIYKSVNNIFWGNRYESSTYYMDQGSLVSNCIVQNFWNGSEQIKNIISEDPKFISPTEGSGYAFNASNANWGLTYFSPAINTGSTDTTGILIKANDIDGNTRLNGERIDIGAYEHQGSKVQYLEQPVGGSYCSADSAVLNASVSNIATFQWQKDGQDIPDATSKQLVLKDLKETSSGNYICVANNAYGKTYSNPAFVQVKTKPEILAQPASLLVDNNSILAVEVMVGGTKPISFTWTQNGNVMFGENSNMLNFAQFYSNMEGEYRLQASNSCGVVTTDSFNLVVKPVAKVQGTDTLYCEGEYIRIDAQIGNNNAIKWYKNGISFNTPYYQSLELTQVSKSDEGNYSFTVTNNYGTYTSNSIFLSINQRPEILNQPVSRWVENNSAFTCEVSAIGAKPLTYQWYFGDSIIDGETNPRFILAGFGSNNEGSYKCQIENVCGTLNTELAAFYITPSVSLNGTSGSGLICENDTIDLSIPDDGLTSFQWYKDGFPIDGELNSTLSLKKVSTNDQGNYSCLISKAFGSMQTTPRFISVQSPPEKMLEPTSQWFKTGATTSAEMSIIGSKPIDFQWYLNDTALLSETNAKIIFASFGLENQGEYYCKAYNGCGTVNSNKVSFFAIPLVNVTGADNAGVICENAALTLSVPDEANTTYQWYKDGTLLNGSTQALFEITNISVSDQGNYSCFISKLNSSIQTASKFISVQSPPEKIVEPSSQWFKMGAAASAEMSVIGSKPINFQWYLNDTALLPETTAKITFASFGLGNQGEYYCKAYNGCGTVNSSKVSFFAIPLVNVTGADNAGVICENATLTLSVPDEANTTYQWYKDGTLLNGSTQALFEITNISVSDQGNYSCFISKSNSSIQTASKFISVQTAPEKLLQPVSQWFNSGTVNSAEISVVGSKPIGFQWFKDDTAILTETAAKIIFTSFGANNQGVYYCKAQNNCGFVTTDKVSFMLKPKIQVLTNRENGAICSGDSLTLSVSLPYTASFQWHLDGAPINSEVGNQLNIASVNESNAGNYSCSVITEFGNVNADAVSVSPRTVPQLLAEPSETWVNESEQAVISLSAIGSKPISYEWFKADVRIDSTAIGKLQINNVLTENEGLYFCKVSNACGTLDSKTVGLYILPKVCLVTADLETGKNLVVWERKANRNIKGYNVYRESVVRDLYEKIGFVNYNVPGVIIDEGSTPELHQNLYKIAVVGANDAVSPMSNYHKTLFLQYVSSQGGVNLMWQPYEIEGGSIEFKSYVLFKGTDPNNLQAFDTISSSLQVYTDTAASSLTELTYYRIKGVLFNACNSQSLLKAGGGPFVDAVSNMEDNRLRSTNVAGKDAENLGLTLTLYPQPASTTLSVNYILKKSGPVTFEIVNILGAQIASIDGGNGNANGNIYKIDISKYNLQNGLYYLKLRANDQIIVKRFMIQR